MVSVKITGDYVNTMRVISYFRNYGIFDVEMPECIRFSKTIGTTVLKCRCSLVDLDIFKKYKTVAVEIRFDDGSVYCKEKGHTTGTWISLSQNQISEVENGAKCCTLFTETESNTLGEYDDLESYEAKLCRE